MTATADSLEFATSPPSVGEVSRYPGSPPFTDTDIDRMLFRGRAVETDEVLHSILSYDLFLVYAVSGMGKTSLLTAGVLEPLRQRGYFPVIVRLNTPDAGMLGLIEQQIRQAADATPGLDIIHTPPHGAEATPPATLWDLIAELELWRGNTLQQLVIIFDQFEELFTLTWDANERVRFIEQFGEVVRRHRIPGREIDPARHVLPPPNVKFVLCMREDFIGQLEDLAVSVPQIMQRRFRLGALTPEQAHAAICEPAALDDPRLRTRRFSYTDGAASTILTFLRTKNERGKSVLTAAIDPSQLQIICQHIERSILPGKSAGPDGAVEITEADLGGQEGLRRIVGDFYRRVLDEFPANERKAIRHLCETGLISQTGRRLSQEEGEIHAHFDVTRDMLRRLVDLRLLRSEPRVGSIYYELAHDTLTGPILAYRDAHRRKRRRRWLIAALVIGGLIAVAVAVLVLSQRGTTNGSAEEPVFPVTIGKDMTEELTSSDLSRLYEVPASGQPLVVELRPSSFDGVIQVSSPGDVGAQIEDVGLTGATEFAVINAGREPHRVEVSGSGPGQFVLNVRPATIRETTVPGKVPAIRLPTTGEPVVLQLDGADDQAFVLVVDTSARAASELSAIPASLVVRVIDPVGGMTLGHTDRFGPTNQSDEPTQMSALAGGLTGTYLVAIVDPSGPSTLSYDISLEPIDITPVSLGRSVSTSTNFQSYGVFRVDSADDRPLYFDLGGDGLPRGEIRAPDGGVHSINAQAPAIIDGGHGRYLVFVTSYFGGHLAMAIDTAEGSEVRIDSTTPVTFDAGQAVAMFRLQAPGDEALLAALTPDDKAFDATLSLVGPGDEAVIEPVDFGGPGEPEQIMVPAGTDGPLLFVVTSSDGTPGRFEFTVRPATVHTLEIGETMSGRLEQGELAAYSVIEPDDRQFAVGLTTGGDFIPGLDVDGPAGDEFAQAPTLFVSNGGAGTYVFTVRSFASTGDFHIAAQNLASAGEPPSLADTGAIREPGELLGFDLDVPDGVVRYVTITTDGDLEIDAAVTDLAGNAISLANEPIRGSGSLTVADSAGPHRVIVSGVSGTGRVTVTSGARTPAVLTPESTQTMDVSDSHDVAVFTVDPGDELLAITVEPGETVAAAVSVLDQSGTRVTDSDELSALPTTLAFDSSSGQMQLIVSTTGGPGEVTIRTRRLSPTAISVGEARAGSVATPGDVTPYEVSVGSVDMAAVSVTPGPSLDAQVVVIEPFGYRDVRDAEGGKQVQLCLFGGDATPIRIIVSGAAGSTGDFRIAVDELQVQPDADGVVSCPYDLPIE